MNPFNQTDLKPNSHWTAKQWQKATESELTPILLGIFLLLIGTVIVCSSALESLLERVYSLLRGGSPDMSVFRRLGFNSIWYGTLCLTLILLFRSNLLSRLSSEKTQKLLPDISTGIMAALLIYLMIVGKSAIINNETYWWLIDDEMISMRYADNLTNGLGLVWNAGERVEGYSNFLWTINMSLVHLFPIPASKTSLVIMLENILFATLTITVMVQLARQMSCRFPVTVAAVAGFVLNLHVLGCSLDGFETTGLTLLFTYSILRIIRESQSGIVRFPTFILISVLSLIRADALVLSGLLFGLIFLLGTDRKKILSYIAVSLIIPAAHLGFRMAYYGDILPSTAYLKTMNWSGKYIIGAKYVLSFVSHYCLLIVPAVLLGLINKSKPVIYLLLICLAYSLYIAFIGGDAFINYRFFMPLVPILLILGFEGAYRLLSGRFAGVVAAYILIFLSLPLQTPFTLSQAGEPETTNIENIKIGLWIRQNSPADCKVADFWAGSVFYFSERYGIDFLGKTDSHIAHLPAASDGNLPGHNKFDFDYSLGTLKPDLVVANFKLPVDEEEMKRLTSGDGAFTGRLYFHPLFRSDYLPNPLMVDTWRTMFRRSGVRLNVALP